MGGTQLALQYLAGRRDGQSLPNLHRARGLLARYLAGKVLPQLLDLQREAVAQHDDGVHALTPVRVGEPDHSTAGDGRMGGKSVLDLEGLRTSFRTHESAYLALWASMLERLADRDEIRPGVDIATLRFLLEGPLNSTYGAARTTRRTESGW
jgi:hypothetical protein